MRECGERENALVVVFARVPCARRKGKLIDKHHMGKRKTKILYDARS